MNKIGGGRRADGPALEAHFLLRGNVAAGLINAALIRGVRPIDLLSKAVEAICTENLFDAVLDDRSEAA